MRYDVFISYRREGGAEIARAIKAELERMGYSVFLDFDNLNDGNFKARISEAIVSSDVFILLLSKNALDTCFNKEDWLRKEIEYAIESKCHIVPVNPNQVFSQYPSTLPDNLREELAYLQISDLMLGQLFHSSLEKLVKERISPFSKNKDCQNCINKGVQKKHKFSPWLLVIVFLILITWLFYLFNPFSEDSRSVSFSDDMTSFTISGVTFEMVYVEGGYFMMGAVDSLYAEKDEFPVHKVYVPDYYIGKYPITQEQWKTVMNYEHLCYYKGESLPVEGVSWFDAIEFSRRLSLIAGKDFDLPTEAEWEYAARGGNKSNGFLYSGGNDSFNIGWFQDNSNSMTHSVGLKLPNELGIYDMSGNVWEWCNDYYGENYYSNCFDSISPRGPQGEYRSNWRVIRGGSIQLDKAHMRVSNRDCLEPAGKDHDIGFRIVMHEK